MERRRFDHLYQELSVELGRLVFCYALWLHMADVGLDPEHLSRQDVTRFCRDHLAGFLAARGLALPERQARRLGRRLARFDPRHPTPYEHMARLGGRPGPH